MRSRRCCRLRDPPTGRRAGLLEKLENDLSNKIGPHPSLERLEMTYQTKSDLIQVSRDSKMTYQTKSDLIQVWRDSKMTHQIGIRNTLHEERFYVDGALVMNE